MPPGFLRRSACLLLLLAGARTNEVSTPSSLLGPENFNHHPFEAGQYLKENKLPSAKPTKKGPVLFPNDAPPPPRPPLIVTSRPLLESVARSDLNPNPQQTPTQLPPSPIQETIDERNTIAQQSQLNRVHYKPGFLARVKDYKPFTYNNYVTPRDDYLSPRENYDAPHENYVTPHENYITPNPIGPTPVVLVKALTGKPVNGFGDYDDYGESGFKYPYANVVEKNRRLNVGFGRDSRYDDYEEKTVLPPIYKALSDYANQNVLKAKQKNEEAKQRNYKIKEPDYSNSNHADEGDTDYNQNSNYAFSYIVKDKDTGDDFSHSQQSSGSATNGEYRVRLPDGRMQIVSYTADENGYKADVRYDDEDKTSGNSIDNQNYQSQNNYVTNNQNYRGQNNFKHDIANQNHQSQNYVVPKNNYVTPTKKLLSTINRNYNPIDNNANLISNIDHTHANNQFYNQQRNVDERVLEQKQNQKAAFKDEYYNQYGDVSNEYENNDYSLEFRGKDDNYQPHSSKFSQLAETKVNQQQNNGAIFEPNNLDSSPKPTLKPSYEDLHNLFIHKQPIPPSQNYLYSNIPIELNVPSTTPRLDTYDTTTERVVVIGASRPNLYTNIRSSITPAVATPTYQGFSTPSSYTEPPKHIDYSGPRPKLSSSFIDRINKYLSY